MTFATPLIAGIAAAVAVPTLLILYFLKLRRRDVEISTTLLWKKAIQDMQANAPFQKLRRNLLLFLQLLALLAALFALAQPQIVTEQTRTGRQIIMIDRSASMNAIDGAAAENDQDGSEGGETRLEAAKRLALEQVESLAGGGVLSGDADEAMVIVFDRTASVVQTFTSDKALLRAAINAITPGDAPGELSEAFTLAKAHAPTRIIEDIGLAAGPPVQKTVYSDGRLPDAADVLASGEDEVVFVSVGSPVAGNIGLIALRADRGYNNPNELTIFANVQNSGASAVEADIELLIDGTPTRIEQIVIPGAVREVVSTEGEPIAASAAGGGVDEDANGDPNRGTTQVVRPSSRSVVFELTLPRSAIATVRVRPSVVAASQTSPTRIDALPTDNEGWLIIPPARQIAVAVVTEGSYFLSTALSGLPLSRLDTLTPVEFEQARRDGTANAYDAIILDRYLPAPTPTSDSATPDSERPLPPGRWLVLGAVPPPPIGLTDLGPTEGTRFIDWERDHPVLRFVTLDPVIVGQFRATALADSSQAEVIATTSAGPGIIEVSGAETRAIVVPFDVAESSWPFDVGFVVFLGSVIDYLGRGTALGDDVSRALTPGGVLSDELPRNVRDVRVFAPNTRPRGQAGAGLPTDDAAATLEPSPGGRITHGPIDRVGVWRVAWRGSAGATDQSGWSGDDDVISRLYATNLSDPDESDVAALNRLTLASRIVEAAGTTVKGAQTFWPWLLLVALGVILFEWWVYNRRVYL